MQTRKSGIELEAKPEQAEDEIYEADFTNGDTTGRRFDIAAAGLSLIGVGISGYLTFTHVFNTQIVCATGNSCDKVNNSTYAYFLGIPVAVLGLAFYAAMLAAILGRARLTRQAGEAAASWRGRFDLGLFLFSLSGVAFTAYLKAMEIFVIGAICSWCVASAVTVVALFGLLLYRFLKA